MLSRALAVLAAVLLVAACGSAPETDRSEGAVTMSRASAQETQETQETQELAAADAQSVEIAVPDDWYEVEPREGFEYQYLWEGNDWDDVLAQTFGSEPYTFSADFFVGLLRPGFDAKSTIEVRDADADFNGYPAIIIDIVYNSGSFTSFTYVDVDGQLWEFTVNSLTPEGLSRGEEINATAQFSG